ncbi:MAG: hypothetical protein K6B14_09775 [Lachnospiraceae bacterium]|nr:hypothetical protein [Lachnospiraceae bacterium]
MACRITQINDVNFGYYLPLLPVGFIEILSEDEKTLAFGIEAVGSAVGAIIVKQIAFEADITWFYVQEELRELDIHSEALLHLSELLHDSYGVSVIHMDIAAGSDAYLSDMFNGFHVERTALPQCIFETTLGALSASDKIDRKSTGSMALSALDKKQLMSFCNELINRGLDYVFMPIDPEDYLADQSAVFMEDGSPTGILLISKQGEDLNISYMASISKSPTVISDMISFSIDKVRRFGEDTRVTVSIVEPRIKTLLKGLLSMEPEDDYGFTYSQRVTLNLGFLDEVEAFTTLLIETWEKISERKAS